MELKQVIAQRFQSIKDKCYKKSHPDYWKYGQKGITVCPEWMNSYQAFLKWCLDNNFTPNKYIFRKDNGGSYSPDNCFIGTMDEYSASQGWKSYDYNEEGCLNAIRYNLPGPDIDIFVINDDAFIDRNNLKKYFKDDSVITERIIDAAAKLEKENVFYQFKRKVRTETPKGLSDVVKYLFNSDELEAIKPKIDFYPTLYTKYNILISILEEWNEYTTVKAKEEEKMPEKTSVQEEQNETSTIEEAGHNETYILNERPYERMDAVMFLMNTCTARERELPLNRLARLIEIETSIAGLNNEKAKILKSK